MFPHSYFVLAYLHILFFVSYRVLKVLILFFYLVYFIEIRETSQIGFVQIIVACNLGLTIHKKLRVRILAHTHVWVEFCNLTYISTNLAHIKL